MSSRSPGGNNDVCTLQVKTLKVQFVSLYDISTESTIQDIYERVHDIETTPDGKWKLMIVTTSLRTLKWSERERQLVDFGVKPNGTYRVEVVLDMGACHGWGRAVLSSIMLGVWLQGFFLNPLEAEAEDMHNQQLDPTEIVLVPYDLLRLCLFIGAILIVYVTTTHNLGHLLPALFGLTLCVFVMYIIHGASPTDNLWHTLAASLFLVLMIQWDIPLKYGMEVSSKNALDRLLLACRGSTTALNVSDRLAVMKTQCVMGLTIVLHILRLYDRGWQAQRWPVPTILGATLGWIAGHWVFLLLPIKKVHV
jgi:hypothetical protein